MQNVWEEISDKLDIVEVIEEYIPVKTIGNSYKAVCPFHPDKNPSLVISPEKNLWHCFGCGAGGNIFDFVVQYENITKKDALQKLAKKAGINLKEKPNYSQKNTNDKSKNETKTKLELGYEYLKLVSNLYRQVLLKILINRDNSVTQYCLKRNLTSKIIDQFVIGFAPSNNFLLNLAKKYNLNLDLLVELGLIINKNGYFKDKFQNRLIFSIFDYNNKVVGFTARLIPELEKNSKLERPKYLNSSQSSWFDKSNLLYGFNFAKSNIIKKQKALLVEGNMDVISCHFFDLNYAVASQGTSFTTKQLKNIKRLTKNLLLAFDNDEAGKASSKKVFVEATKIGIEVQKVIIPEKFKDLDEYLLDSYQEYLLEKIDKPFKFEQKLQTIPYLDYFIQSLSVNLTSTNLEHQKKAFAEILPLLLYLSPLAVEHYLQKVSQLTKKSLASLQKELDNYKKENYRLLTDLKNINWIEEDDNVYHNYDVQLANLLINWQNLLVFCFKNSDFEITNLDQLWQKLLVIIYNLLQPVVGSLQEYSDLKDYLVAKKEELRLILEKENSISVQSILDTFSLFFDANLDNYKSSESKLNDYLEFKKIVAQKTSI